MKNHKKNMMQEEKEVEDLKEETNQCECEEDFECNDECCCDECKDEETQEEVAQNCEDLESNKSTNDDYLLLAQRVQAEFDNYRKRNVEAVKEAEQKGMMKAIEKILPVFDSINSAIRQVTNEEFKKAIETLHNQLLQILEGLNVKKIDAVGLPFDPNKHNAVLVEEREGFEPDIVLEEFQEGFELNGKVIRHSVVKVSK